MDTFIKSNPNLSDIATIKARENLDKMVDFLCASKVANENFPLHPLGSAHLWRCHNIVSSVLYTFENAVLLNIILEEYSEIRNEDYAKGYAITRDIANSDTLINSSSRSFYESVGTLEHEGIHSLLAINGNTPEYQYIEVLSIFGALVTMELLSKEFNDPDIFIYEILTIFDNRMGFNKVTTQAFEDENYDETSWRSAFHLENYQYMLGLIYAVRLFAIYHQYPEIVIADFNKAIGGRKPVRSLLDDYHISLEDEGTVQSFMDMVEKYRLFIEMKYKDNAEVVR